MPGLDPTRSLEAFRYSEQASPESDSALQHGALRRNMLHDYVNQARQGICVAEEPEQGTQCLLHEPDTGWNVPLGTYDSLQITPTPTRAHAFAPTRTRAPCTRMIT